MNDDINPLPEQIEIERVIDGNETKTYECKGTVLMLDNNVAGDRYKGCEVGFTNPVPVKSDDGTLIGHCVLEVVGRRVEGHFFLNYHTPERLELETKDLGVKLYPEITAQEAIDTSVSPWVVAYCHIDEIRLTSAEPFDLRIEPL